MAAEAATEMETATEMQIDAMTGADGTGDSGGETERGSGGGARAAAPSERTTMDEGAADMECDSNGGGGEGSSGGRQAAWELGFDVDELEVRAAGATSAKLAAQAGEAMGVKKRQKKRRGKARSQGDMQRREAQL